eukprot:scaffold292760_cov31-Tisochrysis_lutea.AAC.2
MGGCGCSRCNVVCSRAKGGEGRIASEEQAGVGEGEGGGNDGMHGHLEGEGVSFGRPGKRRCER